MARPTGDEELQLKKRARRRLIGAIVLVMVVVLVLPMVLDNDPKPVSQDIDIRIPSPDTGAFKSKIVPIAPAPDGRPAARSPADAAPKGARKDAPGSKGTPVASEAPATKSEAAKAGPDAAMAPAAADTSKAPVKAEPPKADATRTEPAIGSHVVQVAALLNAERAAEIHKRIRTAGIKSYTEIVKTARGDVTRVRAGPFPTSEAAETARAQIQRIEFDGKKLDGKVIPVK